MTQVLFLSWASVLLLGFVQACAEADDMRSANNEIAFRLDGSDEQSASLAADPLNLRFTATEVKLRVDCQSGVSTVPFVEKTFSNVQLGAAQGYFMNLNECVSVLNSQSLKITGNYKTINGTVHNGVVFAIGPGYTGSPFFESVIGKNRITLSFGTGTSGQIVGVLTESAVYKAFDAFVFNAGYVGQSVLVSTVQGFCSDVVYAPQGDRLVVSFKPGNPSTFAPVTFGRVTGSPVAFTSQNLSTSYDMTSASFGTTPPGSYSLNFELLGSSSSTVVLCSANLSFTLQGTTGGPSSSPSSTPTATPFPSMTGPTSMP